jgi:glutathionylspermidine synthase
MRALRAAPGPPDESQRWEAFLLDAIPAGPLPDFWLYGEPYPALNGIVLDPDEHDALVDVTTQFARIFYKAVSRLMGDAPALERFGFPWVALELLGREPPDQPFVVGRFDFVLDRRGVWQLLEYNADTPSGAREAIAVEGVIARHLGVTLPRTGPYLGAALRRSFRRALAGISGGNGVAGSAGGAVLGIVTDAGYGEDLAQTVFLTRHLAPALAGRGIALVFADVDNLTYTRGRLCLLGRPLDALYRYYPFETLLGQQAFVDIFAAVAAGRLRLLNGLRGLLAQNKGVLAWLWQHRDDDAIFTSKEQRTIAAHLPAVRWIDDVPAHENRQALVLKQAFGREGEEVYFGDRLAADDWERCRTWGSYVVQRRVDVDPLTAVVRTSRGPEVQSLWPAVGSFVVRDAWAGYYTRLGGPITKASAKFVPTFVGRRASGLAPAGAGASSADDSAIMVGR